jgi:hypothetical protein
LERIAQERGIPPFLLRMELRQLIAAAGQQPPAGEKFANALASFREASA